MASAALSTAARQNMLDGQIRTNKVTSEAVLSALEATPREQFVSGDLASVAYVDDDLPLSEDRALPEAMLVARMLQIAEIKDSDDVLCIAGGTGYLSAAAARIAHSVTMLESNETLAAQATENFAGLKLDNASVLTGDLTGGAPDLAPFDVIIIEGVTDQLPQALKAQLAEGGCLISIQAGATRGPSARQQLGTVICHTGGKDIPVFEISATRLEAFAAPAGFSF